MRLKTACGTALLCAFYAVADAHADTVSNLAACADERVKTAMLPLEQLTAAEASCSRVLEGAASEPDRQKAAFFRGLMRFLQVMQQGMALGTEPDGSMSEYKPPTKQDVTAALSDIETAIRLEGPLKGEALALRVTINQAVGETADIAGDIEATMRDAPENATPFVQRALEAERRGDLGAALADLDRAIELDARSGPALTARALLLRRVGHLAKAREDLVAAIALGSPFRRFALIQKSQIEARTGDLRASFEDMLAAARETGDMSAEDAKAMNVDLLIRAGDLALDSLKDPGTAETLFNEAAKLSPGDWRWRLGLGRSAEARGDKEKAIEIYRQILEGTRSTPNLLERNDAAWRLKRLTQGILQRRAGEFVPGFEFGVTPENPSPDGLKRLAFVIGSSNYTELSRLPNARRDATVLANRLADMGFDEVEIAEDVGRENLAGLPSYIARRAAEADIVVVFYAGHGIETGGVNYLIPVDATLENEVEMQTIGLAAQELTAAASKARRGALVIIDACRDDPFVEAKTVAASRGLARPSRDPVPERMHMGLAVSPVPPLNSVVLHSTQPGQTAADGEALDSPFVIALLQTLSTPGLSLNEVVRETAARVSELTNGKQLPAAYGDVAAIRILPDGAQQ
ncbi:caspase family protein [Shinella sp. BYT-45]|uniref:caspase family protein n=1 Tax=Shinella sp. BYT-45 TaxID=3377377 RepID=UPI003980C6E1